MSGYEITGGEAVTVREAAARLGVSVDTVKRRIRQGELETRREPRPGDSHGQRWRYLVLLPADAPAHDAAYWQAIAARYEAELAEARVELQARRREVAELHTLLAQRIPAEWLDLIAARVREGEAAVVEAVAAELTRALPAPATKRRRWWQRG